jgi:hypothetical protein
VLKKIGDLMNEMGFRKDAPDSVKEAFLKHLIKNTTGVELETPTEKLEKESSKEPVQLAFPFSSEPGPGKKVS